MDEPLHCLIEIPKGSRNKYEWDDALGGIKLDRFLFSSVVYPTDYGFVTETLGEDGDPLDAMVCVSAPTFSGCLIPVTAIAVFRMTDDKGQDDKILCVPHEDPNWSDLRELGDLPDQLRVEIEHFFSIYKQPEGKEVVVAGPDPELPVFARSAVKPLQALGSVRAGVLERFGLGQRHLALACASHGGSGAHVEVVADVLAACGLVEDALACGPELPLDPRVAVGVR